MFFLRTMGGHARAYLSFRYIFGSLFRLCAVGAVMANVNRDKAQEIKSNSEKTWHRCNAEFTASRAAYTAGGTRGECTITLSSSTNHQILLFLHVTHFCLMKLSLLRTKPRRTWIQPGNTSSLHHYLVRIYMYKIHFFIPFTHVARLK